MTTAAADRVEHVPGADASLEPFFNPRGVAVIGVSQDQTKLGHGVARNLTASGYAGAIHFVNPRGGALFGRPVYRDISLVPDPVDLVVLVIPAAGLPEVLRACGQRGIKAAIIASGGFREVGPEGAALEAECVAVARRHGMRLIGPNCIGLLDTHLPLDTTFLPPPGPTAGEVAFISHSGAICEAVIDWASGQGFGLSRLISLGNQADVTEADLLGPVAADPHTRVLTLYLEGIRDGRRFVAEAARVTRQKPVIALKVGRFASGQRAVASHTGALAGQEAAYNAAFRRAGVIRAETSEEMFDWARALAWCPLPSSAEEPRVAVLTSAGGPGAIAADALEAQHLPLAELTEKTRVGLCQVLPAAASVGNPVDMLATASPQQYARCLSLLLEDPTVCGVVVIVLPPPMYPAEAMAEALIPIARASTKPVVVALMGENLIRQAARLLRAARIPDYRFPERAAAALAVLVQRARFLAQPVAQPVALERVFTRVAHRIVLDQVNGTAQWMEQPQAGHLLEAYGIRVPRAELARTPGEAVALAALLGYPVALKVASPDIPHKSDVGGVLLNLADGPAVADGFATVSRNARMARPDAALLGVHVQAMLSPGHEVIIGAVRDAQFGPLAMFGAGGTEVEGLRDVAFGLAPLSRPEAEHMLDSTWAGRKLRGYRNLPPADREAAVDALLRVAQLAADFPQVTEIEINPLRVLGAGEGATAVDVRIRLDQGS